MIFQNKPLERFAFAEAFQPPMVPQICLLCCVVQEVTRFCCGQSTGLPVETAAAVMSLSESIHTEVDPLFLLHKLRPASEKPKML